MSTIYNIAFSGEKVISSERNMHRSGTIYKQNQYKTVLNKYIGGFWYERTIRDGLFHWRKHYYGILAGSDRLKLKCLYNGFVSCAHSFSLHIYGWLLLDYCDVLWYFTVMISRLNSHSDGTCWPE